MHLGGWRFGVATLTLTCAFGIVVAGAAEARPRHSGSLTVTVTGLPSGARPQGTLVGPGIHKRVGTGRITLLHVKPGRYTVKLARVRLALGSGTIKAGAVVHPFRTKAAVHVKSGRHARLKASYGTIVNPGLLVVRNAVLAIVGPPEHPTSLQLAGRQTLKIGDVIALAPSTQLPLGVLEHVTAVRGDGASTTVDLESASVYDVIPVARFDVPLNSPDAAAHAARADVECGPTIGTPSGLYRKVGNPRFSGGWNTISILGKHIPVGIQLALDFDLTVGFKHEIGVELGVSCSVNFPVNGTVLGVPVTGSVFGDIHASGAAGAGYKADVTSHVHTGVSTIGVPPALVWFPDVSVGSPTFSSSWTAEAHVTAGFGAGVKFGIGNSNVADATINFNNDLEFEASTGAPGGSCTIQARFASFNAEGKVGLWTVQTPKTPPLFTKTIMPARPCGFPTRSSGSQGGGSTGSTGIGTGIGTGTGNTGNTGTGDSGTTGGSVPGYAETAGGVAHTWTDYSNGGGIQGPTIAGGQTVGIECKVQGLKVQNGNPWWYRIASPPWSSAYYVSADAFYNNGETSGALAGTPWVDQAVPDCTSGTIGGSGGAVTSGRAETAGGVAHTWTNYSNAGGSQGPNIGAGQTVGIACKIPGFKVADGNTWWYRIASSPWNNQYYVSADAFYNNGQTSGSLVGTPFVDPAVPDCNQPAQPQTWTETVGGNANTWTNWTNAGGQQGATIPAYSSVQIACRLSGFRVADGNTWWYRIASSPWNNQFYVSADAFYNNGQTAGSLHGTPWIDPAVRDC